MCQRDNSFVYGLIEIMQYCIKYHPARLIIQSHYVTKEMKQYNSKIKH